MLGAFIVFATFILKDGVKDNLRDTVDAFESAESVFLMRDSIGEGEVRLREMTNILRGIQEKTNSKDVGGTEEFRASQDFQRVRSLMQAQDDFSLRMDALDQLAEKLPSNKNRDGQIRQFHEFFNTLSESILNNGNGLEYEKRPNETVEQQDFRMIRALEFETGHLEEVAHSTLDEARKKRRLLERRLRIVTYTSYALYGIGWGLAFIGRLWGGDDRPTIEDD
jgi:hypothetical protein